MIKPLREAYENYERVRLEEEAVKSATVDSPETSTPKKGLKTTSNVQMFRDMKKPNKVVNKEQEKPTHSSIKNQVLLQDEYFTYIMCVWAIVCVYVCFCRGGRAFLRTVILLVTFCYRYRI